MPRDLAADPSRTVFGYRAIISPPADYRRWGDLVRALARHLLDRYGLDELREHWAFGVWNEANLEVFWSGTPEEYFRLYDVTAAAIKDVDPGLRWAAQLRPPTPGWPNCSNMQALRGRRSTSSPLIPTATRPWTGGPNSPAGDALGLL